MKEAEISCQILGENVIFCGKGKDEVEAWGKVLDAIDEFKEQRKKEIDLVRDEVWEKYDLAVENRNKGFEK